MAGAMLEECVFLRSSTPLGGSEGSRVVGGDAADDDAVFSRVTSASRTSGGGCSADPAAAAGVTGAAAAAAAAAATRSRSRNEEKNFDSLSSSVKLAGDAVQGVIVVVVVPLITS